MSTRQVFILGSPRSGTSALAWALAQHPELWTSAESDFLIHLFRRGRIRGAWEQASERPDGGWLQKNQVDYPEFAQFIGIGIDALFRSRSKDLIWVDQTPGHTLMADILKDMFPFARFVHIIRDGRAVVNSSYDKGGKTGVDVDQKPNRRSKIGDWSDWPDVKKQAFCRMAGDVSKSLGYSLSH